MIKTYVFKLYNSKKNNFFHNKINLSGIAYNHCIALNKRYYKLYKKRLSSYKLKVHLTKIKKTKKFNFFNNLNSQTIQDIVERIDRAYKLFFRNQKHNIKSAPPCFKKLSKYKSFTLKQCGYKILNSNKILILGKVFKYFKSRDILGKIKIITIKRNKLGDIYIYFICELENINQNIVRSGKSVGYDFGLKKFLTASDGNDIESPLFFKKSISIIKKANRSLSRKKKDSNNRRKARLNLARKYLKIARQRKDFHFKLANKLCQEYAFIFIEDLNIKAMKRIWGKKISDYGFSNFVNILENKALEHGSIVYKIDRFYPSSQTCSVCGNINKDTKNFKIREWTCDKCGTTHDRDRNAAINIHRVGASTLKIEDISLA